MANIAGARPYKLRACACACVFGCKVRTATAAATTAKLVRQFICFHAYLARVAVFKLLHALRPHQLALELLLTVLLLRLACTRASRVHIIDMFKLGSCTLCRRKNTCIRDVAVLCRERLRFCRRIGFTGKREYTTAQFIQHNLLLECHFNVVWRVMINDILPNKLFQTEPHPN